MPESQEERDKRVLEELKGKNIAHYSVLLGAWIQTKMERDQTLITLSAGGIGLLTTLVSALGVHSYLELVFFAFAYFGFLATIASCLEVYRRNTKLIESEIRGDASDDFKLQRFDLISNCGFFAALFFTELIGIISTKNQVIKFWSGNMANQVKSGGNKSLNESLQGLDRLNPSKIDRSLSGLENVRPTEPATTQTSNPPSQAPASTTNQNPQSQIGSKK